jgi:hypothetical protein
MLPSPTEINEKIAKHQAKLDEMKAETEEVHPNRPRAAAPPAAAPVAAPVAAPKK